MKNRPLTTFFLIWLPLSAAAAMLVIEVSFAFVPLLMWSVGFAAMLTCLAIGRPVSSLGWTCARPGLIWAGFWIPVVYALCAYAVVWATGLGGFPNREFLHGTADPFGLGEASAGAQLLFVSAWLLFFGVLRSMVTATGEEIGWRGFLAPELMRHMGYVPVCLLTGTIWALWHWPAILLTDYSAEGTGAAWQLACFTVSIVGVTFPITYLALKGRSFWPAAVFHAAHNLAIQSWLDPLTVKNPDTERYTGEFGLVLAAVLAVVAGITIAWESRHPVPTPATAPLTMDTGS
jgi:membrane protease YdiL (CAAX protease family)